jgi:20S proteasome alpha/beta subunit
MAADQRLTSGGPPARTHKIRRIGDSLYGGCGNWSVTLILLEWLEKDAKRDRFRLHRQIPEDYRGEIEVMELSPSGLAVWDGWGTRIQLLDKFYAVGSGAPAAMQAIKRGLSPEESVSETFSLDECSGGTVEVEYLLPPELRTKRKRG